MKRVAFILLIVIFCFPFLGLGTWYAITFLPHLSELREIVQQGTAVVSSAPPVLYKMAVAAESRNSIRGYAVREAYCHLGRKEKQRMLLWHLDNLLWQLSSRLHFTDEQAFSLWVYYAPYEKGHGLGNAARYYYKKPLSELDERGMAALVAATRSPAKYKPGTYASEKRIQEILAKMKKS